jgi:vacuolar-type H+-ATPase subunit H
MREVIQQIIATEDEAKAMVEAAGAHAERILSEARKKGQDMVERARQEARVEAESIVEAAVSDAEREKEATLALARTEIENRIQLDGESNRQAVEGVVRCVCGLR